jgi:hypothetical protein
MQRRQSSRNMAEPVNLRLHWRKVSGFIEGMKDKDYKNEVIHNRPENLKQVYTIVHAIRLAQILTLTDTGEQPLELGTR